MKKLAVVAIALLAAFAIAPSAEAHGHHRYHGGGASFNLWIGPPVVGGYYPYYWNRPYCCYAPPVIVVPGPVYEPPVYAPAPPPVYVPAPVVESARVPDYEMQYWNGYEYVTPYVTVRVYRDAYGHAYYSLHGVSHWLN